MKTSNTGELAGRMIYVPNMSDHAHVVVAAMHSHGLRGEVLPPPDDETLAIGLDLCRGRECLPCFLATGDVVRQCRQPGFSAEHAAFLMPGAPGPCRFGQYHVLQRTILAREGAADARVLTPTSETLYEGFGDDPTGLRRLIWHGFVAIDLLLKARYEYRPYELVAGAVDEAYDTSLREVLDALETGDGDSVIRSLEPIAERFRGLPVRLSPRRPVVALLGEIYVMLNERANQEIMRQLEALGAEVVTGSLVDWMLFASSTELDRNRLFQEWRKRFTNGLQDAWQKRVLRRGEQIMRPLLRQPPDPSMPELFDAIRPHYDPLLGTEATLTLARALFEATHGASGIVNVLPFSCMPGLLASGMAPALRAAMDLVPWLDIWYDAQERTNLRTRLEAFMHQVGQHATRREAVA